MADILSFRLRSRPAVKRLATLDQRAVRAEIELAAESALDTVDQLLTILDQMDGYPDVENGGDDEPNLGAPEGHANQIGWMRGTGRDLEHDHHPEPKP